MAIDEIAKGLTTTTRTAQPIQEEEKKNVFLDVLAAPFRGIEGAAQGVYNLADWATGDELLPDYDNRFLGRSNTIAGGLVEGVSQFMTGFIPVVGVAGKVGKFGTIASKVGANTALKVAKGQKNFTFAELRALKGLKKKTKLGETLKYTSSGAVADFTVFDAQEERLSNLINMNPSLKNPVTEYLAADGEDGEIEGRLKNVIEGLFIEAGMGAVIVPFIKSLKMLKSRNKKMAEGKDKVQATQEALSESELRQDDIDNARQDADSQHDINDAAKDNTGDDYKPEFLDVSFNDLNYKELQSEALRYGLNARGTKEELVQRLDAHIAGINTKRGFDTQFKDLDSKQLKEEAKRQNLDTKGTDAEIRQRLVTKAREVLTEKNTETNFTSKSQPDVDPSNAQKTQRGNTTPTYAKAGNLLGEGKTLDFGAGLGLGSKQLKADSYEPFPQGDFKPTYSKASDIPSDSYENVVSMNTLNVVPPDIRRGIVEDIGRVLKEGGTAVIQTRDVQAIAGIKKFKKGAEEGSKITDNGTYQKGFTKQELKEYVQDVLGDGYEVSIVPSKEKISGSAVVVKKKGKSALDMTDQQAFNTGARSGGGVKNPDKPDAADGGDAPKTYVSIFKELETGGVEAFRNAARLVRTSVEAAQLARAMAEVRIKQMKAEGKVPKTTAKELTQQSEEFASIMGGDINSWSSRINKLDNDSAKYQEVLEEQRVIREMQEVLAESIRDKAKAYKEAEAGNGKDLDEARTELFSTLDQFTEIQRIWSLYGRSLSLGMLQRKFMYKKGYKTRNFGFDTAKNKSRSAQQAYRNQAKGSMSEKKLVNLLAMATESGDIAKTIDGKTTVGGETLSSLNKLNMKMRGRLMFDMNREYWINSLLSAPTTQMVNILGNVITYALRTAETTIGATLTGNFQLAKSQLNLAYHMESVAEAFKLAVKAMKTDEAVTIANHRVFDDTSSEIHAITGENLNKITGGRMDENGVMYKSFDWLGKIARLPSRGLLGGDEFFKALSYRHYLRTELSVQAMNKGIKDPKQIAEYVQKGFDSHITESGRAFSEENILRDANKLADEKGLTFAKRQDFIDDYMQRHYIRDEDFKVDSDGVAYKVGNTKQREDLSGRAAYYAKVNSHTQDAEIGSLKTLSKLIAENPWMTFVVPFVRTPTNILTFGVSRSPLAAAQVLNPMSYMEGGSLTKLFKKEYMDKMNSANARERAELVGRLSTAITVTSGLLYYTLANKDFITGYGAKNKERRDSEKLGGFQEYSIRIPREGKPDLMLSYQRLDPLATILGICADIAEYSEYDESGTSDQMSLIFSNLASTVVNNITNKSYVQGLDNLFNVLRDPTKNGEKFLGNIAGGYVPNVLNQSMNYQEDRMLRETRGMLDYMIKRTPMADKLMPRRNLLGEIETMPTSGLQGVFNPIYQKEIPDSIIEQEIGNMKTGFSKPAELLGNNKNLDMRDFVNEEGGQTAYDRYLELTGLVKINDMTLRQALEKLMRSSSYEAIPDAETSAEVGLKSPRIKEIQKYLRAFRNEARRQMLNEYPELKNAFYAEGQNKINLLQNN